MPRGRHHIRTGVLLPEERVVRESRGWLRTTFPPLRWEGTLVLTVDRILFVPDVYNELIGDLSMWLSDLAEINAPGRARLHFSTREQDAVVELPGLGGLLTSAARRWVRAVEDSAMISTPASAARDDRRVG